VWWTIWLGGCSACDVGFLVVILRGFAGIRASEFGVFFSRRICNPRALLELAFLCLLRVDGAGSWVLAFWREGVSAMWGDAFDVLGEVYDFSIKIVEGVRNAFRLKLSLCCRHCGWRSTLLLDSSFVSGFTGFHRRSRFDVDVLDFAETYQHAQTHFWLGLRHTDGVVAWLMSLLRAVLG
jgi:hypothetical protein